MTAPEVETGRLRLDKWLWHARFARSRTLGGRLCGSGQVRRNGQTVTKAHQTVAPGDELEIPLGRERWHVRVVALGSRRGPAPEARGLFEVLTPPQPLNPEQTAGPRPVRGEGRPTKKDRRALARVRGGDFS